jgi:hypothetical protein
MIIAAGVLAFCYSTIPVFWHFRFLGGIHKYASSFWQLFAAFVNWIVCGIVTCFKEKYTILTRRTAKCLEAAWLEESGKFFFSQPTFG